MKPEDIFATQEEYEFAREQYVTTLESSDPSVRMDNWNTSRIERYEFLINPPKVGEKYVCYVKVPTFSGSIDSYKYSVTTWMGEYMGWVLQLGVKRQGGFTGKRQYMKVRMIDGNIYTGYWYSEIQDCVTLKRIV